MSIDDPERHVQKDCDFFAEDELSRHKLASGVQPRDKTTSKEDGLDRSVALPLAWNVLWEPNVNVIQVVHGVRTKEEERGQHDPEHEGSPEGKDGSSGRSVARHFSGEAEGTERVSSGKTNRSSIRM